MRVKPVSRPVYAPILVAKDRTEAIMDWLDQDVRGKHLVIRQVARGLYLTSDGRAYQFDLPEVVTSPPRRKAAA